MQASVEITQDPPSPISAEFLYENFFEQRNRAVLKGGNKALFVIFDDLPRVSTYVENTNEGERIPGMTTSLYQRAHSINFST